MKRLLACSAFVLLWGSAEPALAFTNPATYALDPAFGGGGGRYFTGSIYDGYTCKVCHEGGATPSVQIRGLPEAGYVPGTTYDVQIAWANPEISHAMMLEFVGATGESVQEIALIDPPSQAERCDQAADSDPAAFIEEVGSRRILGVGDCRSATVRFRFTAPQDEEITFSLAMVRSDSMGTPEGDGALELRQALRRADVPRAEASGCSAHAGVRDRAVLLTWLSAMAWFIARRRRSHA